MKLKLTSDKLVSIDLKPKTYSYLCRMRPPMPGAVPRDGLLEVRYLTSEKGKLFQGWGIVTYDRKLTQEEADHYDLDLIERR